MMATTLGEALVAKGLISVEMAQSAVEEQRTEGVPLAKVLLRRGAVTERQVVETVAEQIGVPFADAAAGHIDPQAAALLPRDVARELVALPVAFGDASDLVVAVADPGNTAALERVEELTGLRATPALAVRGDLLRAIEVLADEEDTPAARSAEPGKTPPAGTQETAGSVADLVDESGNPLLAHEQETLLDLDGVLHTLVERRGSDLHLTAGTPPVIRVDGELEPLEDYPRLTPRELQKAVYSILTQRQRETFENELELDLSYSIPGHSRFRVNVFQQRDSMGAVMRVIPYEILPIEKLGIPAQATNFAYLPRGFVLVTGPTGSGKSTTLASLIDVVNTERSCHIMTVEDPIEFLHRHKRSIVNQRELGTDTHSFGAALKHVLRQDPDVILVGELRDLETIQVALTAAETGHLVFGTLHTQDAPQTIDRIIDVFPPHQQEQIRVMLAGALQGVVTQQLLKRADGSGRVVACEVMMATSAIRNLIREGKTHQMYSAIQAGKQHGMVTMDQSLADLVHKHVVTYDQALERCNNVNDFNRLCGRA
jgi:twitching motility protein PilT